MEDKKKLRISILCIILIMHAHHQPVTTDRVEESLGDCRVFQAGKFERFKRLIVLTSKAVLVNIDDFVDDLESAGASATTMKAKVEGMIGAVQKEEATTAANIAAKEVVPFTAGLTTINNVELSTDSKYRVAQEACSADKKEIYAPHDIAEFAIWAQAAKNLSVTKAIVPASVERHKVIIDGGDLWWAHETGGDGEFTENELKAIAATGVVVLEITTGGAFKSIGAPKVSEDYHVICRLKPELGNLHETRKQAAQHILQEAAGAMERLCEFQLMFNTKINSLPTVSAPDENTATPSVMPESNILDVVNSHFAIAKGITDELISDPIWVKQAREITEWVEDFLDEFVWKGGNLVIKNVAQLGLKVNDLSAAHGVPVEIDFQGRTKEGRLLVNAQIPSQKGNKVDIYKVTPFFNKDGYKPKINYLTLVTNERRLFSATASTELPEGIECSYGVVKTLNGDDRTTSTEMDIYCKRLHIEGGDDECGKKAIEAIEKGGFEDIWKGCRLEYDHRGPEFETTPLCESQDQLVISVHDDLELGLVCEGKNNKKHEVSWTMDTKDNPRNLNGKCNYYEGNSILAEGKTKGSDIGWEKTGIANILNDIPGSKTFDPKFGWKTSEGDKDNDLSLGDWGWDETVIFILIPLGLSLFSVVISVCVVTTRRRCWEWIACRMTRNNRTVEIELRNREASTGARRRSASAHVRRIREEPSRTYQCAAGRPSAPSLDDSAREPLYTSYAGKIVPKIPKGSIIH